MIVAMCKSLPAQAEACAAEMGRPVAQSIAALVSHRAALLLERLR